MAEREQAEAGELLTQDARRDLRSRQGVHDILAEHPLATTAVAALAAGAVNYIGCVLVGLGAGDSLVVAGIATAVVFLTFTVSSWVLGKPVLPLLLEDGENDPATEEGSRYETEQQAATAATYRNMREGGTGAYWIERQLETGEWTVEMRGRRIRDPHEVPSGTGGSDRPLDLGGSGGDGGGG